MKHLTRILVVAAFWVGVSVCRSAGVSNAPLQSTDTPTAWHPDAPTLSLETVLHDVLQNNPSLKAARANWDAMKQRVPQARAWDDARAGFDTVAGRFVSIPPNSFTDQKLMVEQPLPLSGKNLLRGKAAEAEAIASYGEFRRRELDLAARARSSYYRLANAYEQLKINQNNIELFEHFV